jgi:phosphatidylglycerophosphate synthase
MWTEHVSYRLGSLFAAAFEPTRVSADHVTGFGLVLNLAGAILLLVSSAPVGVLQALLIMAIWQAAYGMDCADGQLARARSTASPFGAWLDQVVDAASHVVVFGALAVYLTRALALDGAWAAAMAAAFVGGQWLQGSTAALKTILLGRSGAITGQGRSRNPIYRLVHLTDYGLVIFLVALTLPWPPILAGILWIATGLASIAVVAQVIAEKRRRDSGSPTCPSA